MHYPKRINSTIGKDARFILTEETLTKVNALNYLIRVVSFHRHRNMSPCYMLYRRKTFVLGGP